MQDDVSPSVRQVQVRCQDKQLFLPSESRFFFFFIIDVFI